MLYLVDTNSILRFVMRTHAQHTAVRIAIRQLQNNGHKLRIVPQNCVEFWNVATRPAAKNGFGLAIPETRRMLRLIERLFPILPDFPEIYTEWKQIVESFNVSGVQVHDARLVAAMNVHRVSHILTFNTSDFVRYANSGIVAVDPASI